MSAPSGYRTIRRVPNVGRQTHHIPLFQIAVSLLSTQPLEWPQGVRTPRIDEAPPAWREAIERASHVAFRTGYVVSNRGGETFTTYFEANVHASQVWAVVCDLAQAILPLAAAPIVGVKDEPEPVFGPYTLRGVALAVLEPYSHYLQHDGFLEFGLIHQRDRRTEEVFVKSAKYIQVWTNKQDRVREVFARFGLVEVEKLEFIDEYPLVREALTLPDGRAGWAWVIDELKVAFFQTPAPPSDYGA